MRVERVNRQILPFNTDNVDGESKWDSNLGFLLSNVPNFRVFCQGNKKISKLLMATLNETCASTLESIKLFDRLKELNQLRSVSAL